MRGCGAVAALLLRVAAVAASCALLQRDMALSFNDFPLRISETELNVTVMGAGGSARAAAAMLYVALRYGLGYSTHFELNTPNFCELTMKSFDWRKAINVVAPVATIPGGQCRNSDFGIDALTSRSSVLNESSHLMAYLPHNECKIRHVTNGFLNINISVLETCGFLPIRIKEPGGEERTFFNILARKERTVDDFFNEELQKQIEATTISFNIVYYVNDTEFRREIHKLKKQNTSFLFLDEYIWAQVSNVFPVQLCNELHQCGVTSPIHVCCSFRIGDGFSMKTYAPDIFKIVHYFKPNATDLFNILENEISTDNNTIVEAACTWARQHFEQFKEMIPQNFNNRFHRTTFTIEVYLCEGDQNIDDYKKIIKELEVFFRQTLYDISLTIHDSFTNCLDIEGRSKDLESLEINRSIGSITWGGFLGEHPRVRNGLPLLLIGPIDPDVSCNYQATAVYNANGSLIDLIRAYKHLFQLCKWSRIAILSDISVFSKNFMKYFLSNETKIIHREIIVTSHNIDSALKSLYSEDARIFFVNANLNMTTIILCTALKQGMMGASFMWITRGWRVSECDKANNTILQHYTLELTSRKDLAINKFTKGMKDLLMETADGTEFTPGRVQSSSLADALLQLGYGFNTFIRKYPSLVYSLYKTISIGNLLSILKTRRQSNAQLFAYPLVIIGKWKGKKGNVAAIWHMTPKEIVDINWNQSSLRTCEQLLGREPPEDGAKCLIQTGDVFAPRCHSAVVFSSIAILVFIFAILYIIYHDRKSSILLHKKQYEEYLMSSRQRTTAILENYIVKRNSVQLLHIIGLGSFGQVRFAKLHRTGSEAVVVAAKEPRDCFAVEDENIFLREACVLAPLCHENVIRLVGVCLEDGPPMVLMEHAFYSDLQKYLILRRHYAEGARHGRVTAEQAMEVSDEELTRFGREAAGALEYLATCRLVHRDVRAGNCLVDENRSLKLADFGMARELDSEEPQYVTQRRALFPVIWMAPESIIYGVFSLASDVWSLGVLFLELATLGARPFGEWSVEMVVGYLKSGGHPPLPPDTSTYTSRLVLECWQQDPQARPSAGDLRRRLTRSPSAISPALLTPHPPESPVKFTRQELKSKSLS